MELLDINSITFLPWSPEKNWPPRRLILAKAYEKPESYGSIIIPESFLEDRTGTLWEVVRVSEGAMRTLGTDKIQAGDIIKIRGHEFPAGIGRDREDLRTLVVIDAEKVYQVFFVE